VARSRHAFASPAAGTSVAGPSRFYWAAGSAVSYDYWAPRAQAANGRGRRRRAIRLAGDILAPLGDRPRYYALAWQFLLWLASAALVLIMFG
jgi:hypothetical protein